MVEARLWCVRADDDGTLRSARRGATVCWTLARWHELDPEAVEQFLESNHIDVIADDPRDHELPPDLEALQREFMRVTGLTHAVVAHNATVAAYAQSGRTTHGSTTYSSW